MSKSELYLRSILSNPLVVTPDALEAGISVLSREGSIDALSEKYGDDHVNCGGNVEIRNGVGIININGPIVRRGNMFTEVSGATSTEKLAKDFRALVDDPEITAIMLNINSPGGEATGISEMSDMIYAQRGKKRVVAYIDGLGASAAYWLASSAEYIVANDIAEVGSIGAIYCHIDTSRSDEKLGIKKINIVSSMSPQKHMDPASDKGMADIQRRVDDLASVFVSAVARNRGIDEKLVLSDYGMGSVMIAQRALVAGMIDRISSFEDELKILTGENRMQVDEKKMIDELKAENQRLAAQIQEMQGSVQLSEDDFRKMQEESEIAKEMAETNEKLKAELVRAEAQMIVERDISSGKILPAKREASMKLYIANKDLYAELIKDAKAASLASVGIDTKDETISFDGIVSANVKTGMGINAAIDDAIRRNPEKLSEYNEQFFGKIY